MCQSAHSIHLTQFFKIKGEFLMKISRRNFLAVAGAAAAAAALTACGGSSASSTSTTSSAAASSAAASGAADGADRQGRSDLRYRHDR
jgi:basic membrane protein A